jgi:glutathione synthase/RimK-type ligase-like ATP-grasp enzyme
MYQTLGAAAMDALQSIAACLQLDYGGIDFGIDTHGDVVVFEANATMIVPASGPHVSADRRRAVERIDAAVRRMLLARATPTLADCP